MDTQGFLLSIFTENVGSASIIPFISSITLEAMVYFGGYDTRLAAYAALAGMVVGCAISWLVGRGLAAFRDKVSFLGNDEFAMATRLMQRYGFVLAGFFWWPLGAVLVFITGFFRVPIWKIALASLVGGAYFLRDYIIV